MIKIDVKYIWAKRLNSILKTWFFTTVQTFKLDFLENMKSADGTFLHATVEILHFETSNRECYFRARHRQDMGTKQSPVLATERT